MNHQYIWLMFMPIIWHDIVYGTVIREMQHKSGVCTNMSNLSNICLKLKSYKVLLCSKHSFQLPNHPEHLLKAQQSQTANFVGPTLAQRGTPRLHVVPTWARHALLSGVCHKEANNKHDFVRIQFKTKLRQIVYIVMASRLCIHKGHLISHPYGQAF